MANKGVKGPRVPMGERPAAERVADYDEVPCGYTPEEAMKEAARCLRCPKPKCVAGCPVEVDIPGFIGLVADGQQNIKRCRKDLTFLTLQKYTDGNTEVDQNTLMICVGTRSHRVGVTVDQFPSLCVRPCEVIPVSKFRLCFRLTLSFTRHFNSP